MGRLKVALVGGALVASIAAYAHRDASRVPRLTSMGEFSEYTSTGCSMVRFSADWCLPCKQQAPVFDAIADAHPEWRLAYVNRDKTPEIVDAANVVGVPQVLVFRNGEETARSPGYMGARERETLEDLYVRACVHQ